VPLIRALSVGHIADEVALLGTAAQGSDLIVGTQLAYQAAIARRSLGNPWGLWARRECRARPWGHGGDNSLKRLLVGKSQPFPQRSNTPGREAVAEALSPEENPGSDDLISGNFR
jgi:hypothetical protein